MAKTPQAPQPAKAGPATKGLRIAARRETGFRRCGRFFGPQAQDVPLSELTEDEVETLRNEPQLVVVDVDLPAAEKA